MSSGNFETFGRSYDRRPCSILRGRNLRTIGKSQKLHARGLVSYVELVKLCRSKDIALIRCCDGKALTGLPSESRKQIRTVYRLSTPLFEPAMLDPLICGGFL